MWPIKEIKGLYPNEIAKINHHVPARSGKYWLVDLRVLNQGGRNINLNRKFIDLEPFFCDTGFNSLARTRADTNLWLCGSKSLEKAMA